ncbi:nucleotidyltransferase domain-containing protein [Rossellomorea vietnamensis]|uniref:nucleotidyltransferase domain-containing protein n=1 Tax=Rossellomorea vietnamensis TaxID=218284 RepID=UPI003CF3F93B
MNLDVLFEQVKIFLKHKYNCHTIILYGSYNTGDYTEESDVDIICFSDDVMEKNDVELFQGKQLDVWVYNSEQMNHSEQFLRVNKGKVLLNDRGNAEKFLSEIEDIFNKGPKRLSEQEKDFLKSWLKKMYLRSSKNDLEGNYRLYWMLKDSLEIYFELKGLWFLGPKKAFSWLKENDSLAYNLFKSALEKEADTKEVEQLLEFLYQI